MKIIAYPATYATESSIDPSMLKEVSAELNAIHQQIVDDSENDIDTTELVVHLKEYADQNKVMFYDERYDVWYYPQGSVEEEDLGEIIQHENEQEWDE